MSDSSEPCPNCPGCGHHQEMTLGENQAFCVNVHCDMLTWDPTLTVAENMADSGTVDLTGIS